MPAAIFRDYDQAGLEAQFTLDAVPDLEGMFSRRLQASAAAREAYDCRLGVAYGDGPAETLDIFPAAGTQRAAPVLVFIHGGFWRYLDAATFSFLAAGFVPHGAALVVIDYAPIPAVDLGTIVDQCRRAVAWTHRNAATFGGDAARIHVAGSSAGGHLCALLMDRAWPASLDLPADVVKGGCAISGLFDLEPVRLSAHNAELHWTAADVARFSPLRHIPKAAGPLLLAVGGAESREFILQTEDYAAAWTAAGHACTTRIVSGANHISILLDGLADPAASLNRAVRRQLGIVV